MRIFKIFLASLLALCALCSVFACASDPNDRPDSTTGEGQSEQSPAEIDPFANLKDFEGRKFRVQTSTNAAAVGMGNSNFMIEGPEKTGTDIVQSAVYQRNLDVESILGITLEFTQLSVNYDGVASEMQLLIKSGDDQFDLIINDLYPLAGLSYQNYWHNMADQSFNNYIDFDQNYWYSDYMKDVSLQEDYQFLLAGDYFADVLRSAHCLYFNKNMYENIYKEPDQLYDYVLNYEWTYEKWVEILDGSYSDLNGDKVKDKEDRYGLLVHEMWGCLIPMAVSGNCQYITRDSTTGYPVLNIYNDRTIDLVDAIYNVFYSEGTASSGGGGTKTLFEESELLDAFMEGKGLFVGYQRLGSMESLRKRTIDVGVLPYPMLKASDKKYITSSHDTTEIGVVPKTLPEENLSFVSACLELLCRETSKTVVPVYYEDALKFKYASDTNTAAMIDIIHDNFDCTFMLAYDYSLNSLYNNLIYNTVYAKNNTLASRAKTTVSKAQKKLDNIIKSFESKVVNAN